MQINWQEVATIVITMATVGGVMLGILKGFFQTKEGCAKIQDRCSQNVCLKINEVQEQVEENQKTMNAHYAEIKEALGKIKGHLKIE